ncbi:MAG TPA: hypothetical protein VFI92_13355 [Steroidobacteraceae bacterium]|nr:hypothetical protein [Steroidobacteraceae bacterium]
MPLETRTLLKRDLLGSVARLERPGADARPGRIVERDTGAARWWLRRLARRLAAREARVLEALARVPQVPRLAAWDGRRLHRSWIEGAAMHRAQPPDRFYFREALRLLRRMHAAGVVHNGLAQAPNWLVTVDGRPALIDFQFALRPRYRGRRFRTLAYEDLRDLLAHKHACCAESLTARQRKILARRSWCAKPWLRTAWPFDLSLARLALGRQGSIFSNSSVGASPGRK